MTVANGLEVYVAADVVKWVFTFLDFADLQAVSTLSSYWPKFFRDRVLYKRLSDTRWVHESASSSYRFNVNKLADWKSACLYREKFLKMIDTCPDDKESEILCGELATCRSNVAQVEILRILSELHDRGVKLAESKRKTKHLHKLVAIFVGSHRNDDDATQVLATRAIGALAAHEENREVLMDSISELMERIRSRTVGKVFLREALWSMVILCRPRGGAEGRPFHENNFWQFRATNIVCLNDGLSALFQLLRAQSANPVILSRVFWLFVNLCLCPHTKAILQDRDAVSSLMSAMRRFPDHEELQHRAIFAVINLCVAGRARKDQIFNTGVVQLMFRAMENFPHSEVIHRYSCCVIRALRYDNESIGSRLTRLGVVQRIKSMIRDFPDSSLLASTAQQTLVMFQPVDVAT